MFQIKRLNHLVLYVAHLEEVANFYQSILGFQIIEQLDNNAIFLRANGSTNHHDLGLFSVGPHALGVPDKAHVGLYHAAWEVDQIEDLEEVRKALIKTESFLGQSDHGNSFSLYGVDPDKNEFEVFWMLPKSEWQTRNFGVFALDLEQEIKNRRS
ncbi:MAG: VOC family protein [Candidatus Saccharimonadia bacterium]